MALLVTPQPFATNQTEQLQNPITRESCTLLRQVDGFDQNPLCTGEAEGGSGQPEGLKLDPSPGIGVIHIVESPILTASARPPA